MIIAVLALLLLLSVPLFGGSLRRLGEIEIRAPWLLFLALALQILIISVFPHVTWLPQALIHDGTYVLAGVFVLVNWRIPGLLVIGLGGAMNGIAIRLNGGTLPSDPQARRRAGITETPGEFQNSGVVENPRLAWLGDNYAIPADWPFANVFSLGDVVIVLGLAYALHRVCTPPGGRRLPWRRAPRDATEQFSRTVPPDVHEKASGNHNDVGRDVGHEDARDVVGGTAPGDRHDGERPTTIDRHSSVQPDPRASSGD